MDDNQASKYLQRLEARLQEGLLAPREALRRAFALGYETARMDAMHRACTEYSKAMDARERAFGAPPSQPPPPDRE